MVTKSQINDDNIMLYAASHYNGIDTTFDTFIMDFNRIKYTKNLLSRFRRSAVLRERLILNHVIIFFNVFDTDCAFNVILYRLRNYLPEIRAILEYLHLWKNDEIISIGDLSFDPKTIKPNQTIVEALEIL